MICKLFGHRPAWKFTVKYFEVTVSHLVQVADVLALAIQTAATSPVRSVCTRCNATLPESRLSEALSHAVMTAPVRGPSGTPESPSASDLGPTRCPRQWVNSTTCYRDPRLGHAEHQCMITKGTHWPCVCSCGGENHDGSEA